MIAPVRQLLDRYRRPAELLWQYGAPHKPIVFGFIALSVLGVITESLGVFLLVPLLDSLGRNNVFAGVPLLGSVSQIFDALPAETRLIWAGVAMLFVVLFRGTLQFLQDFVGYIIPHRVDYTLRMRAFDTLIGTSMQYVDTVSAGELSNFTVAHPSRIGIAVRFAAMFVANIMVTLTYVLVLSIVAPVLCAAAAIYVLTSTLLFRRVSQGLMHRVGRETTDANKRFGQVFYELLHGAKLIRLAGATGAVRRELDDSIANLRAVRDRAAAIDNMTVPFFSIVGGTLICILVIVVGLIDVKSAAQAVGVLILFVVLLSRMLSPLSLINISRNNIVVHLDALEEVARFLAAAEKAREADGHVVFPGLTQGAKFDGVSFGYTAGQPPVIKDVGLELRRGTMTAIVGRSGSGKSTLIYLLTRLYRPTSGRILIDGQPLDDLAIDSWWSRMAVVTQDVILTNDSIRANLCIGLKYTPSDAELAEAARMAAIDTWIDSLPLRFETELGERGGRLSGGQRQRIALARAFLRKPEIIILDEATSALDTLTEQTIQRQINALSGEKTLVVIAHRLSTVRRADQIVVLEDGRIAELGRHNELLARRGTYWQMIQSQSLDLVDDEGPEPVR